MDYFVIFKVFCMILFGHFQFWAPTHFSEVVCPRYDPGRLTGNQYQQKSELLYTFTSNKAYLLNIEPSSLVFLKTYNTEFD